MSKIVSIENLGSVRVPELPEITHSQHLQRKEPVLVPYGQFDGADVEPQLLMGAAGYLAPGDDISVSRFLLPDGNNVRPFRPTKPEMTYYVLPTEGEVIVRGGNSYQRWMGHVATSGELIRITGEGKRSIEAPRGVDAYGLMFEVDSSQFDLDAFAEPHLRSENESVKSAAHVLLHDVARHKLSTAGARDTIAAWNRTQQTV